MNLNLMDRPRRIGLSRANYTGGGLHKNFNSGIMATANPSVAALKSIEEGGRLGVKKDEKADIEYIRHSCSSSYEDGTDDINPIFRTSENNPKFNSERQMRRRKANLQSSLGGVNGFRARRGMSSQGSSQGSPQHSSQCSCDSTGSQKRKTEGKLSSITLGAGMTDQFGWIKSGNKRKRTQGGQYGRSSQSSFASLTSSQTKSRQSSPASPEMELKMPSRLSSPYLPDSNDDTKPFVLPSLSCESPVQADSECEKGKQFLLPEEILASNYTSSQVQASPCAGEFFVLPEEIVDSTLNPSIKINSSLTGEWLKSRNPDPLSSSPEPPASDPFSLLVLPHVSRNLPSEGSPKFKIFGLDDRALISTPSLLSPDTDLFKQTPSAQVEEDGSSSVHSARCPFCNQSVNPDDLRDHSPMKTREQEKFCRFHRKKTARQQWDEKRYPKIDWDKLDCRVAKHHSFLRNLINGEDSHYRQVLKERVKTGKDRNLLTSSSNLTPGYYGPRGLRAISENIFEKFTPLLKKRMVQDRLMASRGYTPYVQSVLVPEVVVRLITEDMSISVKEARGILEESAGIGELLSEELRDVAMKQMEDNQESDETEEDS